MFLVPQILLKEYNFDSRHKPTFTEEDILNIFPVVKHVNPKASDAFHFFQSGQAKVQQGTDPARLRLSRRPLPGVRSSRRAAAVAVSPRLWALDRQRASPAALGAV